MDVRALDYLPQEALHIRTMVFVDEQGFVDEFDDIDGVAVHFVAFDGDKPVGTCRIFTQDGGNTYVLGRLCVLKEHRSRGVGTQLLATAEQVVRERGGKVLTLHSQCHAQPFYEVQGYAAYGDVENEQGSPHIWMKKVLK